MSERLQQLFIWAIALVVLAPWVYVQSQAMLNGNVAWLLIAADRMVEGQSMVQSIYETNPPLSILFYAPPILLAKMTAINIPDAAMFLSVLLILASLWISNALIREFNFLSCGERRSFIFGLLATHTIITTIYFLDREHLMMIFLVPFVLCQYAISQKITLKSSLLWPVLIFGSIAILVKPHYGLIPATLFLHRMASRRSLWVFRDPDFIALSSATIVYLLILAIFFHDYLRVILPDVLDYYLVSSDKPQTFKLFRPHFSAYLALFMTEFFLEDIEKRKKSFLLFIYICALLSLGPLMIQMKGYYNHLLPAFGFFILGLSLSIAYRAELYLKKFNTIFQCIAPVLILGASSLTIKPAFDYPKAHEIPQMPVAKYLDENCSHPCTFFAFHGDIEIMNPTALYTQYEHGTRFPVYWFLPEILRQIKLHKENKPSRISPAQIEQAMEKYRTFVKEDLERYKPSVLLIGTNIDVFGDKNYINFPDFFSVNEEFNKTFHQNYEKTGTFEFDRADYFRGTSLNQTLILRFDVYKRKAPKN